MIDEIKNWLLKFWLGTEGLEDMGMGEDTFDSAVVEEEGEEEEE